MGEETDPIAQLDLPPGFRFYPTDEELLVQYLCRKVAGHHFPLPIIGDIDLYKFDPWVLPGKAKFGEKEWYFFSPRERKYPNGSRPNRVAGSGYWKATGTDKIIATQGREVGIKKALVFYVGKAPKGTKTNWIMHEYRLSLPPRKNKSAKLNDWVLCRIYKKNSSGQKLILGESSTNEHNHSSPSSQFDDVLESLPEINNNEELSISPQSMNSLENLNHDEKLDFQDLAFLDWASLPDLVPDCQAQGHVGNDTYDENDMFVPSVLPLCDTVQSGIRTHRYENSGYAMDTEDSLDPFRIRYPYPI